MSVYCRGGPADISDLKQMLIYTPQIHFKDFSCGCLIHPGHVPWPCLI